MSLLHAARARYMDDSVATMSPARLVVMLYDALSADLAHAEQAIDARDLKTVNDRLVHAQDVVNELRAGLDPSAWEAGPALSQLYVFLHDQLLAANVHKDPARIASCRDLVEPLRSAWHQAASGAEVA